LIKFIKSLANTVLTDLEEMKQIDAIYFKNLGGIHNEYQRRISQASQSTKTGRDFLQLRRQ
jgi:hypothetical protein